ncbi:MAG: hypothetical protein ACRCXT_04070 [Paraclostridium sp.]
MIIEGYRFDISEIVNYLKQYKSSVDKYSWNSTKAINRALKTGIITEQQNENLKDLCEFDKNILLKKIISEVINNQSDIVETEKYYSWIVHDWGNIKSKSEISHYEIENMINQLEVNKKSKYNRISSTSKILSFIDRYKYIIYDSRVVYSMNWILVKTGASDVYFRQPPSRNSKLKNLDMNTIIKLKNKDIKYIKSDDNYYVMCELIKEINLHLWEDNSRKEPFYTEMLLFYMADTAIIDDISNSVSVVI